MKFIPLRDFDIVTSALNFDSSDCHVTGGCDLYTTKAAGSDKKLYKNIDKSLESQHAALLKLGASLSPPQRESLAASHNLSRSSPFGNLAEISSRRTFAYLIATLNASHPDYDFSHVLRPADFRRERNLRLIISTIDSTLSNVRPNSLVDSTLGSLTGTSVGSTTSLSTSPSWGPQMWALINKEMHLQDCTAFSYQPADNPFDEEDGAIWAMHYFFFSKSRKRVAYLYVRGVPVMGQSPQLLSRQQHRRVSQFSLGLSATAGSGRARFGQRRVSRSSRQPETNSEQSLSTSATKRAGVAFHDGGDAAGKRARYWLGDQADRLVSHDENAGEDEDEDEEMQDVLLWSREDDSDTDQYFDDDGGYMTDDDDDEINNLSMDEQDEDEDEGSGDHDDVSHTRKGPVRAMSEDIAARMDI